MTQEQFQKHCDKMKKKIEKWPKWKRDAMKEYSKPISPPYYWEEVAKDRRRYSYWP